MEKDKTDEEVEMEKKTCPEPTQTEKARARLLSVFATQAIKEIRDAADLRMCEEDLDKNSLLPFVYFVQAIIKDLENEIDFIDSPYEDEDEDEE